MVFITADRYRVGVGSPVTLMCRASEADHRGYVYSWTHNDAPLSKVKSVISISSFSVQDVGTYVCEVLGAIEIGRGNVVLEEGGKFLSNYGQHLFIRYRFILTLYGNWL